MRMLMLMLMRMRMMIWMSNCIDRQQTTNRRAAEGVDGILWEAQPKVALIKECYPTYFHRRDREGHRE
jgi:hypothetical protein